MDTSKIWRRLQSHCKVNFCLRDPLPITIETGAAGLEAAINDLVSAALCAVANQVVPEEPCCCEDDLMSEYIRRSQRQETRAKIFAIATELETKS
jgi:hypothetical protein